MTIINTQTSSAFSPAAWAALTETRAQSVEADHAGQQPLKVSFLAQELASETTLRTRLLMEHLVAQVQQIEQDNQAIVDDPALAQRRSEAMSGLQSDDALNGDLDDEIYALMERLQKDWLERYGEILGKYVKLFDTITTALNKLKDAINGNDDKGNFEVNFAAVTSALRSIGDLGIGGSFGSQSEADDFLKEMGVDWLEVRGRSDGTYELALKGSFMTELIALFPSGQRTLTPTEYNSLITAKDNIMERLMHLNRVLPDKHQRKLQLWDTLVKTLSGTLESINEVNSTVARNTGS